MRLIVCLILLGSAARAGAQESRFHADLRREGTDIRESCRGIAAKTIATCVYTLATDDPFHVAFGSLAPQNGMGFGGAFVEHWTPNERWRIGWNADAVVSTNGSHRAGAYMKVIQTPSSRGGGIVVRRPGDPVTATGPTIREYPIVNVYAQAISLQTVPLVAGGDVFRERQTIVGTNVIYPLTAVQPLRMSVVGTVNGRLITTESDTAALNQAASFVEFQEGVRLRPAFLSDRVQLNYSASLQQFVTSAESAASFHRWSVDLRHDFPVYRTVSSTGPKDTNGPDECAQSVGGRCPSLSFSRNREGSVTIRLLANRSQAGAGSVVPFYLQPTMGGSDLNGQRLLSAFDDYRFRGTNLFALQESIEHSVWGPIGIYMLAEQGSLTREGSADDFVQSVGIGITVRAGGFPLVNLTFAWGSGSHHVIGTIEPTLLGGSSRPSLY